MINIHIITHWTTKYHWLYNNSICHCKDHHNMIVFVEYIYYKDQAHWSSSSSCSITHSIKTKKKWVRIPLSLTKDQKVHLFFAGSVGLIFLVQSSSFSFPWCHLPFLGSSSQRSWPWHLRFGQIGWLPRRTVWNICSSLCTIFNGSFY